MMETWIKNEFDNYFSDHINVIHLGKHVPKYHVLKDPDNESGWVIGVFYSFIGGEYVPLEEIDEEKLIFSSPQEAFYYIEHELEDITEEK